MIFAVAAAMTLSSCGTYTGSGAYTGSALGSILGSAIGGISGGPHGSDVGTLIGMAGGAIVGGSIGAQADKKRTEEISQYHRNVEARQQARSSQQQNYTAQQDDLSSGFDPSNSADDRIYDFNGSDYTTNYTAQQPDVMLPASSSVEQLTANRTYGPQIVIENARFVDDNRDNVINRGELGKVIFEVYNRGTETVYDVQPMVVEATGNSHIAISPGVHIEKIEPGCGVRYTAMVQADNRLKNGQVKICLSVLQGGNAVSKVSEFVIPTRK